MQHTNTHTHARIQRHELAKRTKTKRCRLQPQLRLKLELRHIAAAASRSQRWRCADALTLTFSLSHSRVRAMKMPKQRERERQRELSDPLSKACVYMCVCMLFAPLRALSLSLCWPLVAFGFWFRSRLLLPCIPIALWEWKEPVEQLGNSWELGQDNRSYFSTPLLYSFTSDRTSVSMNAFLVRLPIMLI